MNLSIRKKLTGTYFLIILITVVIFEVALIGGIKGYYLNGVSSYLKNQAELVSSFYNDFLQAGDLYSNAGQIVEGFSQGTFQMQITDKRGKVIADSLDATNDEILKYDDVKMALAGGEGEYRGRDKASGERVISYTAALRSNNNVVGSLRFTSSVELTYQIITKLAMYLIAFGIILILLVFLISFFLAQNIVEPIEEITATARQMARGKLGVRSKIANNDETGILAATLNNMAEQIQQNEIMKSEFISSVSHELRTPLTSIKGWAQTLKGTPPEEVPQLQYGLDIIIGESDRLTDMVEELLDFSRLESSRLVIHPEPANINHLLFETYQQMQPRAVKQGIDFKIDVPNSVQELNIDYRRIKQVLINLLDNAFKFTPAGGTVGINGQEQKDCYVITISDSGCGIPGDEIARIKERFYKGRENTANKGTGLGLAICDELVKLHGGTMTVSSELDKGTSVIINIPLVC